jgi:hypothetical protein
VGNRARIAALAAVLAMSGAHASDKAPKISLVPKYYAGQILRYQIDMSSQASSQTAGPILNPQGAHKLERTIRIIIRLEVLSAEGMSADSMGCLRMRATYDEVDFASSTDAFDEGEQQIADKVKQLEGKSVEFTLEPNGEVTGLDAPPELASDPAAQSQLRQGLAGLLPGTTSPLRNIAAGDKWSSVAPIKYAPLAGLSWRNDSTYVRNESCGDSAPAATCAIVLTKSVIVQKSQQGEHTPKKYLQDGLRSMGNWTGRGQSLMDISLETGLVTRLTQTGTQDLAFVITSEASHSKLQYFGHVDNQTEIKLLPPEKSPPAAAPSVVPPPGGASASPLGPTSAGPPDAEPAPPPNKSDKGAVQQP